MNLCGTIYSLRILVKYELNKSALSFGGHHSMQLLPCQRDAAHRAVIFSVASNAEWHSVMIQGLQMAECHGSHESCLIL